MTSPEEGRYEMHWLCAPAFAGDELLCSLGSTCMHARWPHWPRQIDQFSIFYFFSHAYGRQEVSTADYPPRWLYQYICTSTNQRCDAAMPLAGHSFRCVCSLHDGITRMLWEKVMKVQENTRIIHNLIERRIDIFKPGTPGCWLSDVLVS